MIDILLEREGTVDYLKSKINLRNAGKKSYETSNDISNIFRAGATRNEMIVMEMQIVVEVVDFLTIVEVAHTILETSIEDADILLVMSIKEIVSILPPIQIMQ